MLAFRTVPRIPGRDPERSGSPDQPNPEAWRVSPTRLGEKTRVSDFYPKKTDFGGQYEAHAFTYPVICSAGIIHTTNSFHLT
jgi:hypothetical protein